MDKRFHFFVLILSLASLISCTRATENSSTLSIAMPSMSSGQNGSQTIPTNSDLIHVSINITGPGINPAILLQWDAHNNGVTQAAPTSFNVDVPQGDSRLVQVLAVYQDSTTRTMSFNYGDYSSSFNSSAISVFIDLTELGTAQSISGRVSGRILSAANDGPTGALDILYTPAGKPSMVVERTFIASGWFSVFMLSGVPLNYLVNGVSLFGGAVDLNDSRFAPANNIAKAGIPVHIRKEERNNVVSYEVEEAEIDIWGFWALPGSASAVTSAVASKIVCNGSGTGFSSGTFTKLYPYNPATPISSGSVGANLSFNSASFPSIAQLTDMASPMSVIKAVGGFSGCSSADNTLVSNLPVSKSHIDGNGGDSVAGFRNIFVAQPSANGGGQALTVIAGTPTGSLTVTGQALPGVSGTYDKVKFYKRFGPSGESDFHIDNPYCAGIGASSTGYTIFGEGTINSGTGVVSGTNMGTGTSAADISSGRLSIVACAYNSSTGKFAEIGYYQGVYGGGGGGGFTPQVADAAKITMAMGIAGSNQCHEAWVELGKVNGGNIDTWNVTNPNNMSIAYDTFTSSGTSPAVLAYGTLNNCQTSGAALTNLFINPGKTRSVFWVKYPAASTSTADFTMAADMSNANPFDGGIGTEHSIEFRNTAGGATNIYVNQNSLNMSYPDCREVFLARTDGAGDPVKGSVTIDLSYTTMTGSAYTVNSSDLVLMDSCDQAASPLGSMTLTFGAEDAYRKIGVKRLTNANSDFKLVATIGGGSNFREIMINPAPLAHHIQLALPGGTKYVGDCLSLNAISQSVSGDGATVNVPSGRSLPFNLWGSLPVNNFSATDCLTAPTNTFSIGSNTSMVNAWFMPMTIGNFSLYAESPFLSSMNSVTYNQTVAWGPLASSNAYMAHFDSKYASPSTGSFISSTQWPTRSTASGALLDFGANLNINGASSDAAPETNGVLFTAASRLAMSSGLSDEFVVSARFKIANYTTVYNILELIPPSGPALGVSVDASGNVYYDKGAGAVNISTALATGTTYVVTLSRTYSAGNYTTNLDVSSTVGSSMFTGTIDTSGSPPVYSSGLHFGDSNVAGMSVYLKNLVIMTHTSSTDIEPNMAGDTRAYLFSRP